MIKHASAFAGGIKGVSLVLSGLLVAGHTQGQTLPDRIAKAGQIKIGVTAIDPPMEYRDPKTGKLVGFDVDLANALAKELGVTIVWQELNFDQLLPSLKLARLDMVLSDLSDNQERRAMADFIDYMNSGVQFVTSALRKDINRASDLCGKTVGASRGTTFPSDVKQWSGEHCVAFGKAPIRVEVTDDNGAARSQLKRGRIDAMVQGSETVPYVIAFEPGVFQSIDAPFGGVQLGIAFNKIDEQLRDALLAALKKLMSNDVYTTIIAKWSLQTSADQQVGINGVSAR